MTEAPTSLDERYGRTRHRGVDAKVGWTLAGIGIAIGLAVLLFGGWQNNNTVEGKVQHYNVASDRSVQLDFQVSAPKDTEIACALEALSESKATVGWKVVVLPPSQYLSRDMSETIETTYRATTGTVRSCWVTAPA